MFLKRKFLYFIAGTMMLLFACSILGSGYEMTFSSTDDWVLEGGAGSTVTSKMAASNSWSTMPKASSGPMPAKPLTKKETRWLPAPTRSRLPRSTALAILLWSDPRRQLHRYLLLSL